MDKNKITRLAMRFIAQLLVICLCSTGVHVGLQHPKAKTILGSVLQPPQGGGSSGGAGTPGLTPAFTFKPGGTADPTHGIYVTWSSLYTAASAFEAPTVNVDTSLGAATVPSGTWNLQGWTLAAAFGAMGPQTLNIADGAHITANSFTVSALTLNSLATSSPAISSSSLIVIFVREAASLQTDGTSTQPFVSVSAGMAFLIVPFKGTISGSVAAPVYSVAGTLTVFIGQGSQIISNTLTGAGSITIDENDNSVLVSSTQTGASAITINSKGGATQGTAANSISYVDLANRYYPTAIGNTPGANENCGNGFWQTSPTATTAGGRLFWKYSGSGTDSVTVFLWRSYNGTSPAVIASANLSINASGVQTFSWGSTVPLFAYQPYSIVVFSASNGFTSISASGTYVSEAITNGAESYGAPPYTGTIMFGPNVNWGRVGVQWSGTNDDSNNSHGFGSYTTYCPVEATVIP